jgi:acyl-CoA reductase-like NAD-dependent aldehyde dehydrogenase
MMDTIDARPVEAERQDDLHQVEFERGFYNIINGQKVAVSKRLPVINPVTKKQLVAVPDADRALLNRAITGARQASSEWGAFSFGRRKAILASLLSEIEDHSDELCALLTAERGGPLAQARWEIDLLTQAFGPALMQMEVYEKEKDRRTIEQITQRFVPIDDGGVISRWNLPVILSFGKVLPALLTGATIVLRPSPLLPLTVLRISDYIRELLPPGVFNVVTGGQDLWPWITSHSGIDLINFTRSKSIRGGSSESAVATRRAATLDPSENDSKAIADVDPEQAALFGRVALVPVNCKPGRVGLASALFEILSFRPVRMRTQILVWSLARKASYAFPWRAIHFEN